MSELVTVPVWTFAVVAFGSCIFGGVLCLVAVYFCVFSPMIARERGRRRDALGREYTVQYGKFR